MPRGWSQILRGISYIYPPARMYRASLNDGDTLFLDLSQYMCHSYLYSGELFNEQYSVAFFERVLEPGDVFLDIGANIGYLTKVGARLVGEQGAVFAFEPMPDALRVLKENTRALNNVKLYQTALSDKKGSGDFSVNKYGNTSSLGENPGARRTIQVPIDTLDNSLKDEKRIDVIKIDVEGFELEVLRGATAILAQHRPLLYFEVIPDYTKERSIEIDDFNSLLVPYGYTLHWMNPEYPKGGLTTDTPSWYTIGIPAESRWSGLV